MLDYDGYLEKQDKKEIRKEKRKKKNYFMKEGLFLSDFIQSFTHSGNSAFGMLKLKILEASSDLISLPFLTPPVLTNKVEVI